MCFWDNYTVYTRDVSVEDVLDSIAEHQQNLSEVLDDFDSSAMYLDKSYEDDYDYFYINDKFVNIK